MPPNGAFFPKGPQNRVLGPSGGSNAVLLQCKGVPESAPRERMMIQPMDAAERSEGRRKVLIIDDDPALTMLLGELFRMEGCEVATALDGLDAIQLLETGLEPDLIVLDMHMDGGD